MENSKLNQELQPIKAQVTKAVAAASALEIKTAEDMTKATDILGKIKAVGKLITNSKKSMTDPLNLSLRNIRSFFLPVEAQFIKAENIVKTKMLAYQTAEEAKAAKEIAKVEKKVETGKMDFDQAAEKIEAVTPAKTVAAKSGAVQFRITKDVEIEDAGLLPREYLVPDMVKIRKVALAGIAIPGVRVVEKKIVAGIARV